MVKDNVARYMVPQECGAKEEAIPTISKTGYSCSWNTSADGNGTTYNAGDVTDKLNTQTLYARCSANTYKITYDANGGKGAPATQEFVYDSGAKISTTVPTRVGYTFSNWKMGNTILKPGDSVPTGWNSFTLVAQWTPNTNTAYKVVHQQMNLDGSTYTTVETEKLNWYNRL